MIVSKQIVLLLIGSLAIVNCEYSLKLSTNDITVLVDQTKNFDLLLNGFVNSAINVTFVKATEGIKLADLNPSEILINTENQNNENESFPIEVLGKKAGHLEVETQVNGEFQNKKDLVLRILVANNGTLIYVSIVIGWIYFAAWSISFYPQIWINYKRKSVVGLNFDFLALNIVGFIMYSLFNVGLFWIPEIQKEYSAKYPTGVNPVLLNDVVFALHAVFATTIAIYQCFIYEIADQRVSVTARSILGGFLAVILISMGLVAGDVILWLDFLYICSYIKLAITLIKYIPQAVMNYRRKSTIGWSIGNILLDFTGGALSMLQMMLNAHNYDDWKSIFGDPTKFGLGLFSVLFDVFFILQHYVFYRNAKEITISTSTTVEDLSEESVKK